MYTHAIMVTIKRRYNQPRHVTKREYLIPVFSAHVILTRLFDRFGEPSSSRMVIDVNRPIVGLMLCCYYRFIEKPEFSTSHVYKIFAFAVLSKVGDSVTF